MEIIEIPFGAKDSELQEWEYTIPDGMEAEIRDGKVIIKKKESEDERIRKAIVALIEDIQQSDKNFAGVELTDMLAYLEKQKINTEGDFGRGYDCGYKACLNSHGAEFFEKQKEQKPVDLEKEAVAFCFDNGINVTPHQATRFARHFYELGRNARKGK